MYHLTPDRMASNKNLQIKAGRVWGKGNFITLLLEI